MKGDSKGKPMNRRFFNISASKDSKVAEIHIYGVIGSYWEGNDAKSFQREFSRLEKEYDRINVYINSPGGSVWDGLPIFNAIRNSEKEVHTYVVGIAFSMGFMILLAAKEGRAHAYKGSLLMGHTVSTFSYGNAKAFRKEADNLEKYDKVLTSLIAERTGRTDDEVRDLWMNHEDHYFTPSEALEEGFIDFIEDDEAEDMPENVRNLSQHEIAAYYEDRMQEPSPHFMKKVMDQVKAFTGHGKANNKSNNMFGNKFSKMTALAKVAAADVTAELVEAANTEIAEMEIEGVTLVLDSELQDSVDRISNLESEAGEKDTKITNLEAAAAQKETEITNLKSELAKLKGKPAEDPVQPKAEKNDAITTGEADQKDDFATSVDAEHKAIWGS